MATYLSVPLKKTFEVDLIKPLRQFIANTYTTANADDYEPALQEFNKLRNNMIAKSADKHESALEVLNRYYDQLSSIESKFPITENQIRINFKWQDCFDKETFFSGKRTLTVASSSYEKVCVLFNIGAMASQIAEGQNVGSDDGLKTAAKLFMQSSGAYSHLKDCVLSHVQGDPTPDLHPDTLAAISALMLAQAQDCFVRKAMNDKMKPAIIAKLSHQCSDFYAEAMKLLQLDTLKMLWPKDWIPSVVCKQAAFHALAEYFQSLMLKESKEFGQEIARLQHAKELIDAAENRGGYTFIFQDYSKRIYRGLEEAKKDNDFIYHAKVPELSSITPLGKHAVAKVTPVPDKMSSDFTDLFGKVVPLAVHQALCLFENRKAEIVNTEIGRMREATQLMNSVLASLNLPAAIEDLSGTSVPQSLLEKGAKTREMGGITYLSKLMQEMPDSLKRNKEILDEAERQLAEEENSDTQLKSQFKDRWTRTPSAQLTGPIRDEANKYRTILNNAVGADKIVQERYSTHKSGIDILSKADADIQKSIPSGSPAAALKGSPVVAELRKLMEKVETIKAERDVIESEIKEAKCDMTSKFMRALAQDGALDEHSMSEAELDKIYSPLREQVSSSIHSQETVMANVQRANDQFSQAKAQNTTGASREQKLKDLAAAYDSFVELKGNLEEGTKFYNDLTQLLVKFQSKSSDFCFARKTEKEELMKDLSSSIARQNSAPPPAAPNYQQPPGQTGSTTNTRTPPSRPPPPTRQAQAAQPPPVAQQAQQPPPPQAPAYGQQPQAPPPNYPNQPPSAPYGAMPYPVYPQGGYIPPPMPAGYNPYGQYGYPQGGAMPPPGGNPPYPQQQQQYPGYAPPYPQQQQWR